MDLAFLIGMGLGLGMFVFGVVSGGASIYPTFVDVPSIIITIGGSLSSVLASNKMPDFINGIKGITMAMKEPAVQPPAESIKTILNLANVSRKEGLLALEQAAGEIEDEFLKKGIMLVVDGTDPELVRAILETELVATAARHKKVSGFWDKWGEMGPAWGMIGTLVGLVIMLGNLEDVSTIGPSMAVALLTTLYGSLIANWITGPTSAKLQVNDGIEASSKEVVVEGLLSIQAGENPRVIEEKLKTFLPPADRAGIGEGGDEGGE